MGKSSQNRRQARAKKSQQPALRSRPLWIAVVLAGIGIVLSLYATNLTFKIATGAYGEASGCSINEWINCDLAHSSSYARLFGVPVAWWGLLFYAFAGLTALSGAMSSNRSKAAAYLTVAWILSIFAVAFSLYKASNLVNLKVLCPVCVAMYIANIGIMFALPAGLSLRIGGWRDYLSNYFQAVTGKKSGLLFEPKPVAMAVTLLALFGIGYAAIKNYEGKIMDTSGFDVSQAVTNHFRQRPFALDPKEGPAVWGNPDSKVTVVEFADFQCPACQQSAARFRPMLWEFRNDIRYMFFNLPLDSQINEGMASQLHALAGDAARAGVCAQEFGDFWEFHDEVFRNQLSLGRPLYQRLAEERGWDTAAFSQCMVREDVTERIKSDISVAASVSITSTPTIMVNGRKLDYWGIPEFTQAVIREELSRQ